MKRPVIVGIVSYKTYAQLKNHPKPPSFDYRGPDDSNYTTHPFRFVKSVGAKDGFVYVVVNGTYHGTYDISVWLETGVYP